MRSTTLTSILTIPAQIISSTREALTPPCRSCLMLQSLLESERSLTRELLGLQGPMPTTSESLPMSNWPKLDLEPPTELTNEFDQLSPEIRNNLIREYQEHLAQYPGPVRINREVEEIIPGQTTIAEG
jgi:hypothetical protein